MAKREKATDPAISRCIGAFYRTFVRRNNPASHAEAWLAGHGEPGWLKRVREAPPVPRTQMVLPMISGGKEASLMKRMIESWGEETVLRLIELFFRLTLPPQQGGDPRIIRTSWDITGLYMNAQYLLTRDARTFDQRTADNLDAARRAMQSKAQGAL